MEKNMSLNEAIRVLVEDGDTVVMGACHEPIIPFAAAHEIIRQKKQHLTLVGTISDIMVDMMIGAGVVKKVIIAWVGNVSGGLGNNYRRAVEKSIPHPLEVEDHSNFSIGLSVLAGAMGVPFLPTKSLLGTDLLKSNPRIEINTYQDEKLAYVPALTPNVAIIGVQRADIYGNSHLWGNTGIAMEAAMASKKVILLAEEIVSKEVILSDPNRVLVPSYKVTAVVHCPGFNHPSPFQGFYQRDHEFFHQYHKETKTEEGFGEWLNDWVLSLSNHEQYLDKLGRNRLEQLKIKEKQLAAPVNYADK
ncbi:CoA transferase subunit A [Aquibacillus sp. 3ASR75-11]|uniref:CoA transferase subunit A n=1 Tax=Terrihalobacillus insolitus TaxID=2950438 RepID=A0A9X4ALS4_9BACI|nr:CoA-transferase [Terrihalobacillus insolitus]MDC3415169.1 CoA transferase subunit A [Terrihalobacillus insolitus]MDC3424059.1 CoA transferase subunit A [Terrihalobacillus insolitus]